MEGEQDKQDKFFQFTKLALQEWQEGQRQKLGLVTEEICRAEKEVSKIRVWGKVLLKCLLEFQKQPQIFQHLVGLVLRRVPWFTSRTHLLCPDVADKLIMNILSLNHTNILQVFKVLLEQLLPKNTTPDLDLTLHDYKFNSALELTEFLKDMFSKDKYQADIRESPSSQCELMPEDQAFCRALLQYHPDPSLKNTPIQKLVLGLNQAYVIKTRCLFIVRPDGSTQDVSYLKCVQGMVNHHYYHQHQDVSSQGADLALDILAKILRMNPISRKQFGQVFREMFPHKKRPIDMLLAMFKHSLKLTLRCKEVTKTIIEVLVQCLLSIDSEVAAQKEEKKAVHACIYEEMPQKLERLLEVLYEYLAYVLSPSLNNAFHCASLHNKQSSTLQEVCKSLLLIFQEQVLVAHRVKYVQNIYLHISLFYQQYPDFYQKLITLLLLNCQDSKVSKVVRTNSVYYLAGFLIRMEQAPEVLSKSMTLMAGHLDGYVQKHHQQLKFCPDQWDNYSILSSSTINHELALLANRHQVFFCLAQALLYILTQCPSLSLPAPTAQLSSILHNHQELFFIYLNDQVLLAVYALFDDPAQQMALPQMHQVVKRWKEQHKNKKSTNRIRKYKQDFYDPFSGQAAQHLVQAQHQRDSPQTEHPDTKELSTPVSQGDTDSSQLHYPAKPM